MSHCNHWAVDYESFLSIIFKPFYPSKDIRHRMVLGNLFFYIWYFKQLGLNYLTCYKGCHRARGGSWVVPDDPVVLYEAQNITVQKIWSSSRFSPSHIPQLFLVHFYCTALLTHLLTTLSTSTTPLPYICLYKRVLLGMLVQSTFANLSLRNILLLSERNLLRRTVLHLTLPPSRAVFPTVYPFL